MFLANFLYLKNDFFKIKNLMKNLMPVLAVLSTVFFWGSSFPVMSFLLETVAPMILATGRFSLAALLSLLWCVYNYKKRISLKHSIRFFIAGFVGIFLYNILVMIINGYQ